MALTLLNSPAEAARFLSARGCTALQADSRRLRPGEGFVAWPGYGHDARTFVQSALASGAAACLVEAQDVQAYAFDDPRIAALADLKAAAGPVAAAFHGDPSTKLDLLAVTGTNGKTSTAWWIAQALSLLGRRCGVVGTLGIGEPPRAASGGEPPRAASGGEPPRAASGGEPPRAAPGVEPAHGVVSTGLTTPDPLTLQAALARFVDQGLQACAIEASSIGIVEQRLAGTRIAVALLSNLTRDHLDYHGSMAAYWAAKQALFDWPGLRAGVINIDDPHGTELAAAWGRRDAALWTVSIRGAARLQAAGLHYQGTGLAFDVLEDGVSVPVRSTLVGDYNASNLMLVLAGLRALGVPLADAAAVLPQLTPVPGRLQPVAAAAHQPAVLVDYAHTPDALDQVLQALRPLATARGGRLWCVFGCGGNRDATKRPLMGAIAARLADRVVLTSDNPRDEPPCLILTQILAGTTGIGGHDDVAVIEDRGQAIGHAIAQAAAADVVLLAGKGHEDYQEVAGTRRAFLDADVAARALRERADGGAAC